MIVFLTGLPGTGKSTLANYFMENPIKGWIAYDFDKGKYKIPMFDNKKEQKDQLDWWISCARSNAKVNSLNTIIFGFWGNASILDLNENSDITLAWLDANLESLNSRYVERGTPEFVKDAFKPWQEYFIEYLQAGSFKCFNTDKSSIEETIDEISDWLLNLCQNSYQK